jgi:methionyl-tRNA formyltransferase
VNKIAMKAETAVILEQKKLDHWKLYWKWVKRHQSLTAFIDNPYLQPNYFLFDYLQDQFEERFFRDDPPREFSRGSLEQFYSVNDPECVTWVKDFQPDLIVSFGIGLVKKELLAIEAYKVNIHRGIIPLYRGLDSDLWAFYFQDFENVGTTIHQIEARFDVGNIFEQQKLTIEPHMKAYHIRYYTTMLATEIVERLIDIMSAGTPKMTEQDLSQGQYYSCIPPLKRWLAMIRFERYRQMLEKQAASSNKRLKSVN